MGLLLVLLLMVAAAYLLGHFVVDRLQRRYLFVSGAEYIVLGLALSSIEIFDPVALAPVIIFAVGYYGIVYGLELDFRKTIEESSYALRLSLVEFVCVAAGVGFLGEAFLRIFTDTAPSLSLACGAMLACAAAAGSSSAVDVVAQRFSSIQTQLLPMLRRSARLSNLLSIVAFGILICVFHRLSGGGGDFEPSEWAWITLGIGMVLGLMFAAFLVEDDSENSRFLAITGITCFASGAAAFLSLSAITVNLFMGAVLGSTKHAGNLRRTLASAGKPMTLILLVFAGAFLQPVPPGLGFACCAGFLLFRVLLKAVGCWIASAGTPMRGDLFRGSMAQGEVALAIALSFRLFFAGEAVDLAYAAVLCSVAFSELVAPRLLRGLLVDAGELRQDLSTELIA
jgi:hypothetical protein